MRSSHLILLLLACCFGNTARAQTLNLEWAKSFGGNNYDYAYCLKTDAAGNVYTTGFFYGTVDFDPGSGVHNLTSTGDEDIFVSKLDANGNFLWAKNMGGRLSEVGYSIAVDAAGNVYTTGIFTDTADFDPGPGVFTMIPGNIDAFVSKLDANGNFVWAKQLGGTDVDIAYSLALDASSNVLITGEFSSLADFDPGAGSYNLLADHSDVFICKLTTNGAFVWAKKMGGAGYDQSRCIATDAAGNVYTTGSYTVAADFDPGAGTYTLTPGGYYDAFVSKLDPNGNFIWAKDFGKDSSECHGQSITVDASQNVYLKSMFFGTVDFDPGAAEYDLQVLSGSSNTGIVKLDANGNFIWARKTEGQSSITNFGNAIAVDNAGNVYTTGFFTDTCDFDPGPGVYDLIPPGYASTYICRLNADGNFVWAKQFENAAGGFSIAVNTAQELYISGCYIATADFDPEAGVYNLTSNGSADCYIAKLQDTFVGIDEQTGLSFTINAYPNPANEQVDLVFTAPEKATYTIELFNALGQLLYSDIAVDYTGTYSKQINTGTFGKGVYLLSVRNEKSKIVKKLILD